MFEICRVDAEVLSSEERSPLAGAKDFSDLREGEHVYFLVAEIKKLFNFVLFLLEEVSMMPLIKEEVL